MAPSIIGNPRQTDVASLGEAWLAAEWPRRDALWTSIGSLFIPMWDGRFHTPPQKEGRPMVYGLGGRSWYMSCCGRGIGFEGAEKCYEITYLNSKYHLVFDLVFVCKLGARINT